MNHLTLEELLELREATDRTAPAPAHLFACSVCSAELARLRALQAEMKTLSAPAAPDRWNAIRAVVAADRHRARLARQARLKVAGLAVAATLLLTALAPAVLRRMKIPLSTPAKAAVPSAELNDLVAQSHALESRLQSLDAEPRPLDSLAARQMLDFEDRISGIDAALARTGPGEKMNGPRPESLWRERVELLGALVDTRDPQPQAVGL